MQGRWVFPCFGLSRCGGLPIRVLVVLLLLAPLPLAPSLAASDEPSPLVDLAREAAARAGVAFDPDAVVVEVRSTSPDGVVTVRFESLVEASARLDGSLARLPGVAPAPVPEIVGGALIHVMVQVGVCRGYDDAMVAGGIDRVAGSWGIGYHATAGAPSPSLAVADPAAGPRVAADSTVLAAGDFAIEETFLRIFGFCLATLGAMEGTGVAWFDQSVPLS